MNSRPACVTQEDQIPSFSYANPTNTYAAKPKSGASENARQRDTPNPRSTRNPGPNNDIATMAVVRKNKPHMGGTFLMVFSNIELFYVMI